MKLRPKIIAKPQRLFRPLSTIWLRFKTSELDPIFYVKQYDDLRVLESEWELRRHYLRHGRAEGRIPSKSELNRQFDIPMRGIFESKAGESSFRTAIVISQVMAWCGDRLSKLPANRGELLRSFIDRGIEELWPLRFDLLFDTSFYLSTYRLPFRARRDAPSAYRHYLSTGLKRGWAPNEAALLKPYLGGMPYPGQFDWKSYSALVGRPFAKSRISALTHLFTAQHSNFTHYIGYLGTDGPWLLTAIGRYTLLRGDYEKAARALEAAASISEADEIPYLLGGAYLMSGRQNDALDAYRRSIASGSGPLGAYLQCVDLLCTQHRYDEAFEVLREGFLPWRHAAAYGRKLDECVNRYFQHQSSKAHAKYREWLDDRNPATALLGDELLRSTLDDIRAIYLSLADMPAPSASAPDGHIAILANDTLRQCTHYRVEQKVEQLEAAGIEARVFAPADLDGFLENLVGARAAIFYRIAATPDILRTILCADCMGLPTYYEIDDLIFDPEAYPDAFESFEGQIDLDEYEGLRFGVPLFRYALSICSGSIASTTELATRMQPLTTNGSSILLPNGLDSRNEKWIRLGARRTDVENARIRLFYGSGTKAHNADFNELLGPVLADVLRRFSHVDLIVVGYLKLGPELAEFEQRVQTFDFTPELDAYWGILASCDINLSVLRPTAFADCKSAVKWLEAAVLQIPSVVSETATYNEVVNDGVDGFVATNPAEWAEALETLITDQNCRRRVGANARSKALSKYSLDRGGAILKSALERNNLGNNGVAERGKLRVLVCNVFFDPQSHGGATRVVEDNIRCFSALYDDLSIGVFCSDEGNTNVGRLRVGRSCDVPVFRLAIQIEPRMEWKPFDEQNAVKFGLVVDHFKPDIVHFHCVQRLTASIVEETLRRDIPYIVTLHDGWWISDYQFLSDADGFLRLPTADVIEDSKNSPIPSESIERGIRLRSLLQSADALLSVSDAFRQIYENAGLTEISTLENGVPDLSSAGRRPRPDGRVAIGHIGGRAAHKGAYLIEAALRQENYENLHLTMIDGTLAPGTSIETMWGTTPVTLSGPYPQSRVQELYSQLNVLVAPSCWPESYGLVTREALASGLWVVASTLGAIGDDVVENQNGHLINTETAAGLKRILREIDRLPNRYLRDPEPPVGLRPTIAQARELHSIYWQMHCRRASEPNRSKGHEERRGLPSSLRHRPHRPTSQM